MSNSRLEELNDIYSNLTEYEKELIIHNLNALASTELVTQTVSVQTRAGDEGPTLKNLEVQISKYTEPTAF